MKDNPAAMEQADIASLLGISTVRVCVIERKAIRKL